jgi:hypothetical protein
MKVILAVNLILNQFVKRLLSPQGVGENPKSKDQPLEVHPLRIDG